MITKVICIQNTFKIPVNLCDFKSIVQLHKYGFFFHFRLKLLIKKNTLKKPDSSKNYINIYMYYGNNCS